jgi:hypothetical protein
MLTTQVTDLLRQLRSGRLDTADATVLEQIPSDELISDLRALYPVLFQERVVARKHEIGMAHSVQFEVAARRVLKSLFPAAHLLPILRNCLFLSSYDNAIGEITTTASLHIRPDWATNNVVLKMGRGFKLDRTPDGWAIKKLKRRAITLSEELLADRGWKFDVLVPFNVTP